MDFDKFTFAEFDNIIYLLVPAALLLVYIIYSTIKGRVFRKVFSPEVRDEMLAFYSRRNELTKVGVMLAALVLLVLALMRPQYDIKKDVEVKDSGIDIILLLDISKSMKVKDVVPDRLTAAKLEIFRLLDTLRSGRVALVPFAGIPFVQSPFTTDFGAIKQYLEALTVTDMPVGGTAIGRALKKVHDMITGTDEEFKGSKFKALVVFTDGENLESDPKEVAGMFGALEIKVFTVGIGTGFGKPVPLLDAEGRVIGYQRNQQNQPVISGLDEKLLQQIASLSGGEYFHYQGHTVSKALYSEIEKLEKYEYSDKIKDLKEERFHFFLLPALVLLMGQMMIPVGRRRRRDLSNGGDR